jgi:hypothetical protein
MPRKNMKINKFDNEFDWQNSRIGKITGTKLKEIVVLRGTNEKVGFYDLIAERLAKPKENENAMERGKRLEVEAVEILEKKLNKVFVKDLVTWDREDYKSISISPDAYSLDLTTAVEVKCLNSGAHIKAVIENKYPDDYKFQVLQYFIVNECLQSLYFVMYDPRLTVKEHIYFLIQRSDVSEEVEKYFEYQVKKLNEINKIVNELSF